MLRLLGKLLDSNEKQLNKLWPLVKRINELEPEMKSLSDGQLKAKTAQFREALKAGQATLKDLLPEAFAVGREAIYRTLGERAFDVQLLAGIILHQGKIAEQRTGEGKTHAAALALYLNALAGKGVHLITVNDYLARRDAGWYGQALHLLGLSVGCIIHDQAFILDPSYRAGEQIDERLAHLKPVAKKEAYEACVTYGTNSEFGFDYLRDNMAWERAEAVQRGHYFAIVDEVDFALIDEARTPLIISAPAEESTEKYYKFAKLAEKLVAKTDYTVDEKSKTANLTSLGIAKVENWLGVLNLYEQDFETLRHIEQALRAKVLFHRDRNYVVSSKGESASGGKDGEVIIVDEFTGRLKPGHRYSEGLHQAIEAKEGCSVQRESKTLASISFQNYFRRYKKLAGMTGTAVTEAEEFYRIYGLEVVIVPTHRPMIRKDENDLIYKTERAKWQAVLHDVEDCHRRGQPVLIGTTSIEKNELLDDLLKRKGIRHEVLNAKQHEREALIFREAGKKDAVTVATNMAGRGVDIKLGGDAATEKEKKEVIVLGGLRVIGTERHEARRIDNQLRGRAGRQGEPGSSRFYISLKDDLMRLFGGDQVKALMDRFGLEEDIPLEHGMVSKSIEQAQKKVEGHNFDLRKHLVEYDDVMNKQREIIYNLRQRVLEASAGSDPSFYGSFREWFLKKLLPYGEKVEEVWQRREKEMGEAWRAVVKHTALKAIDVLWVEHLTTLEDLREGIGLRGYGGRDPLVEYKNEAHKLFEKLVGDIYATVADRLVSLDAEAAERESSRTTAPRERLVYHHQEPELGLAQEGQEVRRETYRRAGKKVGRNDPCPCGSGKKYKKCHGAGGK